MFLDRTFREYLVRKNGGRRPGGGRRPALRLPPALRRVRPVVGRILPAAALAFSAALAAGAAYRLLLPRPLFDDPYSLAAFDRNGELLGAAIAPDGQWRFPPLASVPHKFRIALVEYEDARFAAHPGVDLFSLARAFAQNLAAGEVVSGGSTISMQVIRLQRRRTDRSVPEKLIEALLALRLETEYGKDEIVALFAAHAPFGGNTVGLEAAAWRYFARSPERLSWAESALLAVLPNSPGLMHPGRNRDRLKEKRDRLLEKLRRKGYLSELDCRLAQDEPLPDSPLPLPREAPHLLARLAALNAAESRPEKKTYRAVTTVDRSLQAGVGRIVERHVARLSGNGIHNAAACVLETATGRTLAYVGNVPPGFYSGPEGEERAPEVDVLTAPRSTGSLLKPLLYAAMLDRGELLPTELVPDIPTRYGGFRPENDTKTFRGAVTAKTAIAQSLNVPSVRLLRDFGLDRFYAFLKSLGMTTLFRPAGEYGLTLILGGAEGTLWELTGIYAGLGKAALSGPGGPFLTPYFLESARPSPDRPDVSPVPPISRAAAWLTLEAMLEVERPGEDVNWRSFTSSRRIAWKTGTSYGHRDAWSIGITPRYTVGVWVGNATGEGRPGLQGSLAAAPLLFDIFNILDDDGETWFDEPAAELETVEVCAKSGFPRGPNCEEGLLVKVPRAVLKTGACPYCTLLHLDKSGRYQVSSRFEKIANIVSRPWFVLPPAMEWYYKASSPGYRPVPPWRPDCRPALGETGDESLSIIFPAEGSLVYIPIELDGKRGKIVCSAAHRDDGAELYWHLDGVYLGATAGIHQMAIAPPPGEHTLTVVDSNGEFAQRKFKVLSKDRS
jgi:penicillin-binding protein 1C